MDIKKIDPRLLKAIEAAAGFPNKPYDLTKVKAIKKWPDIGLPFLPILFVLHKQKKAVNFRMAFGTRTTPFWPAVKN